MDIWVDEVFEGRVRFGLKASRHLFHESSAFQKIDIYETEAFGRVLLLDDKYMASELDEHFYHEMLVHPAMTTAPSIAHVLVIGGGDGGTVREILRHPEVEKAVMVEIDGLVVEACRTYLPAIGSAWDDPRLEVIIGDGIEYVKRAGPGAFDVIFLDGCDPVGPAEGLFTIDFYRDCRKALADRGVFALQSESPLVFRDVLAAIQKTLGQVFKSVHPYFGPVPIYPSGAWSWTFASDVVDPLAIHAERASRITEASKYYNAGIHRAAFAVPNDLKKALAAG